MRQDSSGVHYQTNNFQCRKKYVKVGKYAKQQITVLLIINTFDEKESPVIIGSRMKPRYFKNIKDNGRPCGSYYYANKKA